MTPTGHDRYEARDMWIQEHGEDFNPPVTDTQINTISGDWENADHVLYEIIDSDRVDGLENDSNEYHIVPPSALEGAFQELSPGDAAWITHDDVPEATSLCETLNKISACGGWFTVEEVTHAGEQRHYVQCK